MTLILKIENIETLPEGVPASMRVPQKGRLDIGRYERLGWTLPDPGRFISGKHCEIHYRSGTYWLYDNSTNGTFMNGMASRIKSPQPLSHGDRVAIGIYVIAIAIEPEDDGLEPFSSADNETICRGGRGFATIPFIRTVTAVSG